MYCCELNRGHLLICFATKLESLEFDILTQNYLRQRGRCLAILTFSNTMAPALLAHFEVATATLQYILPMASITHFTAKCTFSTTIEYTLKSPRVFAFVSLQQSLSHDFDSVLALSWLERSYSFPVNQLFRSFNNVLLEPSIARARFPFQATYIAELCTAATSSKVFSFSNRFRAFGKGPAC